MKHYAVFLFLFLLPGLRIDSGLSQQRIPVINNELKRAEIGKYANFYCNPLLLDGKPLDYNKFNLYSKGELTLVSGDPSSAMSQPVSFYVQLQPNGAINQISDLKYLHQPVYSIEVSSVLATAKAGDLLVITPSSPVDWKARRVIKINDAGC